MIDKSATAIIAEPFPLSTANPINLAKSSSKSHPTSSRRLHHLITGLGCIVIFALSIWLYASPLWHARHHHELIVDERHLFDGSNVDVEGTSTLLELWGNDYWGRSIHRPDSHKSWRPLTVLTFRYGKLPTTNKLWGIFPIPSMSSITWHRMINVLLHAVVAQFVGLVARRLPIHSSQPLPLGLVAGAQWLSILIFAWHPTHVEVVANAANRPHLLAVLASCIVVLTGTHSFELSMAERDTNSTSLRSLWGFGSGLFLVLGLLCSETMVFQLPAILLTATLIQWGQIKRQKMPQQTSSSAIMISNNKPILRLLLQCMLPLWLWWITLVLLYLGFRYWADTLSIPNELFDRAEVPFHDLTGWTRIYSFAYVLAIHVSKAVGIEWVGPAHEYSFNCISPIESISDFRIYVPLGTVIVILLVTLVLYLRSRRRRQPTTVDQAAEKSPGNVGGDGDVTFWLWLVVLSWFVSLLSISGLVKVGTFIADRIVVPSTVGVSLGLGRLLLLLWTQPRPFPNRVALIVMTCWWWWGSGSARILRRTKEWTQIDLLLLRTQETCPSSAKTLLQLSKLYSAPAGSHRSIQPDLGKALLLVKQSHTIDPDFCRVHYQFAHVYLQTPNYPKMEKHLAQALVCPNTGVMAMELWNKYWPAIANQDPTALSRRDEYLETIMKPKRTTTLKSKKRRKRGKAPSARKSQPEL